MAAPVLLPEGFFAASQPVSLYIHVPFCTSKCDYCAFYSLPSSRWKGGDGAIVQRYLSRLLEEVSACTQALGRPYETIFFGGGNPGCLPVDGLESLLAIANRFGRSRECTVEMNPESLTAAHFPLFERYVDRLSMGVQSLDGSTLRTLGRNVSLPQILAGIGEASRLRERCGTRLSFDLMTCIPGQSKESALSDIDSLYGIVAPEHVSLYCLTLEEGTPLYSRLRERDESWQADILSACWEHLAALGYEHYEVSNFAKPGARSLHNGRYWKLDQYVGLGPAAAGTAFFPAGLVRWECPADLDRYCSGTAFVGYAGESLSRLEELEEYLLVALRVKDGIDKAVFQSRFGFSFDCLLSPRFLHVVDAGSYIDTDQSFSCSESGWMVLDDIVVQLAMEADRMGEGNDIPSKPPDCPVLSSVAP